MSRAPPRGDSWQRPDSGGNPAVRSMNRITFVLAISVQGHATFRYSLSLTPKWIPRRKFISSIFHVVDNADDLGVCLLFSKFVTGFNNDTAIHFYIFTRPTPKAAERTPARIRQQWTLSPLPEISKNRRKCFRFVCKLNCHSKPCEVTDRFFSEFGLAKRRLQRNVTCRQFFRAQTP